MTELQPCGDGLLNPSPALCPVEKGEAAAAGLISHDMDQVLAELQRERQKNAQLVERISALESLILKGRKDNQGSALINGQDSCTGDLKRKKVESSTDKVVEHHDVIKLYPPAAETNHDDAEIMHHNDSKLKKSRLVNWMSMDDETQFPHEQDRSKEDECSVDADISDGSDDDEDDNYPEEENTVLETNDGVSRASISVKEASSDQALLDDCKHLVFSSGRLPAEGQSKPKDPVKTPHVTDPHCNIDDVKREVNFGSNEPILRPGGDSDEAKKSTGYADIPFQKKPSKLGFCPKEVKRILEPEALSSKNAQSHTVRKILVFASLGIRHGCEDMYDLDYNHFSILRKDEPYASPSNPGEHVLYDNPGVRRKMFYPNRDNPTLCPVQILEEEKVMRPSDGSCPSCLFLCIKYGGRTRNLPQNEYVRQRMGRKKLKSFGPLICQMAGLVNIRTGSFFFKALGITLLYMAGFPDDIVQRETDYRNLDLVQKYYRTDADAEGEELFHAPVTCDLLPSTKPLIKSRRKKQTNSRNNSQNLLQTDTLSYGPHQPQFPQCTPRSSITTNAGPQQSQFSLMGYASIPGHAMGFKPATPSPSLMDTSTLPNPTMSNTPNYQNHVPLQGYPHQPPNNLMPLLYWPPPPPLNAYPPHPCHFPSPYGYLQSLAGNYMSVQYPQPYYGQALYGTRLITPKSVDQGLEKNAVTSLAEANNDDSESSLSSTEPKVAASVQTDGSK